MIDFAENDDINVEPCGEVRRKGIRLNMKLFAEQLDRTGNRAIRFGGGTVGSHTTQFSTVTPVVRPITDTPRTGRSG